MDDSRLLPIVAALFTVWVALVMYEIGYKIYTWHHRGKVRCIDDLKDQLGVATIAQLDKVIFRDTACGCMFKPVPDGVEVTGDAEGADAECEPHVLSYPFTMGAFWVALAEADNDGCDMWHEWNSYE